MSNETARTNWSADDLNHLAADVSTLQNSGSIALRKGRRSIVDEITAPLMPAPPTLTYSAAGTSAATIGTQSSIANGALVAWTDSRFRYLGGTPEAYTSAGHGTDVATVVLTDAYQGNGVLRADRQWWVEFDFEGTAFEILEYANTSQWSNIYVDGLPVAADPVQQSGALTGGSLYLRRVDFGVRGKHTIKVLFEAMLFGGIYKANADTLQAPTMGDSLTVLHIADSYGASGIDGSSDHTHRVNNNYVFRMARRLGIANIWNDSIGGTGVVNSQSATVPVYLDRLSRWPTTADLVVVQASKNDSALITAATLTGAALQAATVVLLQAIRARYPNAYVVVLGIVKPGTANADEVIANTKTGAAVTQMGDSRILFVDTLTAGWFTGTGKVGSTTNDGNADTCLASDGSHPSTEGHVVLGDFAAAAISAATGIPMLDPAPSRVAPRYRMYAHGYRRWDAQTTVTGAAIYENAAGTLGAGSSGQGIFYLDPADGIAVFKLRHIVLTNDVAPGITFTASLKPVSGNPSGGATAVNVSGGTDVTGSSVAIATPALDTKNVSVSADFACPTTAGYYVLVVALSGNMAANSSVVQRVELLARDA
jgi:lysophospholipase L1-like esterase